MRNCQALPEDMGSPEGMAPREGVRGTFLYEASMAEVGQILGIDQQQLENALARSEDEMVDQGPWQRPANGNRGPWGADEE